MSRSASGSGSSHALSVYWSKQLWRTLYLGFEVTQGEKTQKLARRKGSFEERLNKSNQSIVLQNPDTAQAGCALDFQGTAELPRHAVCGSQMSSYTRKSPVSVVRPYGDCKGLIL